MFSDGYAMVVLMILFVSLAAPVDKAISYFRLVSYFMTMITIASLWGASTYLFQTGFYPEIM